MDPRLPRRAIGSVGGSPVLSITPDARTDETLLAVEIAKWMRVELSGAESRLRTAAAESSAALQSIAGEVLLRVLSLDMDIITRMAVITTQLDSAAIERRVLQRRLDDIRTQLAELNVGFFRRLWRTLRG